MAAIEKSCPDCNVHAKGKREVTKIFGWRTSKRVLVDGTEVEYVQPQSRCQPCKTAWNANRYRKAAPYTLKNMTGGTAGKKRPNWKAPTLTAKYRKATGDKSKRSVAVMWKALGY